MDHSLLDFEQGMRRALEKFDRPKPSPLAPPPRKATPSVGQGLTVKLAVRKARLSPDTVFTHTAKSISRLSARIEAEQAARKAGYHVGHVIDYSMGD